MFKKTIIAVAAVGLIGCAHTQETEPAAAPVPAENTTVAVEREVPASRSEPVTRSPEPAKEKVVVAGTEPDNTKVNARDRNDATLTPMDQGNSEIDLKITQEIRKAVVGADGLSFSAKNVKIITQNAHVTLRGPVKSASEKTRIDELARGCAGVAKVDNQLEVASR